MTRIFLVGFMGSGKTSVAKQLQKELKWPLKDTDEMIEKYYGMNIPTIFAEKGEAVFRQYETNMLKRIASGNTIIATGGGIIEKNENREWLKKNGMVFFLDTSWQEIFTRLENDESRPIWNNQSRDKQQLLHKRLPLYKEVANEIIQTDGKSVEQIAAEIITNLSVY